MMKRVLALVLCLCALCSFALAEGNEEILKSFVLHHGDRNVNKIAITVDDCYKSATEWIERDVEMCKQYGIKMTFFPLVHTGCLEEAYRDLWQSVLDAGCEIGTHSTRHTKLGNRDVRTIIASLALSQEALDKTLGYHYQIRCFRPPYGSVAKGDKISEYQVQQAIRRYGYEHVIHWDVSQMKDMRKALESTKNGSILLFHTKKPDTLFLEKLIPELQARGFEMVTVSELFGFDPPEISDELYVYSWDQFENKK